MKVLRLIISAALLAAISSSPAEAQFGKLVKKATKVAKNVTNEVEKQTDKAAALQATPTQEQKNSKETGTSNNANRPSPIIDVDLPEMYSIATNPNIPFVGPKTNLEKNDYPYLAFRLGVLQEYISKNKQKPEDGFKYGHYLNELSIRWKAIDSALQVIVNKDQDEDRFSKWANEALRVEKLMKAEFAKYQEY